MSGDKQKVTVISLDYDGCGCVLNDDFAALGIEKILGLNDDKFKENLKNEGKLENVESYVASVSQTIKEFLEAKLGEYTKSNPVDLYVGSNRQSIEFDNSNAERNKNGSCLKSYPEYAEDKEGWTFRPLLLADKFDESGSVRGGVGKVGLAIKNNAYYCEYDKLKTLTIEEQLKDVFKNHGDDKEITFVFIDDDSDNDYKIIPALQSKFSSMVPSGLNVTLKLVKFDWFRFFGAKLE